MAPCAGTLCLKRASAYKPLTDVNIHHALTLHVRIHFLSCVLFFTLMLGVKIGIGHSMLLLMYLFGMLALVVLGNHHRHHFHPTL